MSHFRKKATADLNLYASFNITIALFQLIALSSQQHDLEESFLDIFVLPSSRRGGGGVTHRDLPLWYGILEFFNANIVRIFHRKK